MRIFFHVYVTITFVKTNQSKHVLVYHVRYMTCPNQNMFWCTMYDIWHEPKVCVINGLYQPFNIVTYMKKKKKILGHRYFFLKISISLLFRSVYKNELKIKKSVTVIENIFSCICNYNICQNEPIKTCFGVPCTIYDMS